MSDIRGSWQVLSINQNTIVRCRFDPGFVLIQTIAVGRQQAQVSTIQLRNEEWYNLVHLSKVKPEPAPWTQNPAKVEETLGLNESSKEDKAPF